MRRRGTTAVLMVVAVIAIAAVVDVLRGGGAAPRRTAERPSSTTTSRSQTPVFVPGSSAYPACRVGQLRLAITGGHTALTLVVRHVRGATCRVRPTRVHLSARGPHGENLLSGFEIGIPARQVVEGNILQGNSRAGVALAASPLNLMALCASRDRSGRRYVIRARAGPYRVRHTIVCPSP